jgi:hypothetical protein
LKVFNPVLRANSLSIATKSRPSYKRDASGRFQDISHVPSRNFDWLPFTPLPLVVFSDPSKVSAEHYVHAKDYVSIGLLSHACFRMEQIVDILDATSDKLQEALDGPSPSDVEDLMDD